MSVVLEFIQQVFAVPFGFILGVFYTLTNNYIFAIIMLTVLVKMCFLPGSIKQHKSTLKMKKFKLKVSKLKEVYKDNPEQLKQATDALQKRENLKKGNHGCLTFIVQLIVLIGLFNVIYTPLTNVLGINKTTIQEITTVMSEKVEQDSNTSEITILKEIDNYKDELVNNGTLTKETLNEIIMFRDEYNFMGINLSHSPEIKHPNALWLIPLLVLMVGLGSSLYSLIFRKKHNPGTGKFTALDALPFLSPLMLFLFAFMFPAGVGLYWAISNLLSFFQTIILNIIYNPYKVVLTDEEETQLLNNSLNGEMIPENEDVLDEETEAQIEEDEPKEE